ncbi:hypothetical protein [Paenibacillus xylanexedens]|uniref:hypothetical protein n=1 Tax=Paenibacillus xylanexedens TaxID=528191 RepID=UPI000F52AF94|nr:hypothetical protein [Paenibacillus xylanexedens]RPK31751.1 hypothetical protein EDO6_02378 [Paenibacillus xylanexedens]
MNLYKIKFEHFAPKGSKAGIVTYLIATSDEAVYEWMKLDKSIDDNSICTGYVYHEEDEEIFDVYDSEYNVIGQESFKEKTIRLRGEIHDEEADVSDAYYGVTLYGWDLVTEEVSLGTIEKVKSLGINIETI